MRMLSIVLFLLPSAIFADAPNDFESLKAKVASIKTISFRYKEHWTPTGHMVSLNGKTVPMERNFLASVSQTSDGKLFYTFESKEALRDWAETGTFISDGVYQWEYTKRGGSNNPPFISKKGVNFQKEDL